MNTMGFKSLVGAIAASLALSACKSVPVKNEVRPQPAPAPASNGAAAPVAAGTEQAAPKVERAGRLRPRRPSRRSPTSSRPG